MDNPDIFGKLRIYLWINSKNRLNYKKISL